MSGMWKRSTVWIMRHRRTKGPETDRPDLHHRATSRLYTRTHVTGYREAWMGRCWRSGQRFGRGDRLAVRSGDKERWWRLILGKAPRVARRVAGGDGVL